MSCFLNLLLSLILGLVVFQKPEPTERVVEPADLVKDSNLIGREVTVDDRIRYFQPRKGSKTQVLEEFLLKRSDVVFRIPAGLHPEHPPRQPAIKATGILQKESGQYFVDVISFELMPADTERLDRELKRLAPGDAAGRASWAAWAERRAKDFKDNELASRARAIEMEIILMEADRPNADHLALANRSRDRKLGDDLVAGLAHMGFQKKLKAAKSPDDLAKLASEVASFLPNATEPKKLDGRESWQARMQTNAIPVYRNADPDIRAGLDRALFVAITQKRLESRLAASPGEAQTLAEEAKEKLPDYPEIGQRLRDTGLAAVETKVTALRLSEVEDLARTFKNDGQPERARKVLKEWLDLQRKGLHPSDADGHILLAEQYNRLISDRTAAAELLRAAIKADPQVKGAVEAFRRMGFRKSADTNDWYDPITVETPAETPMAPVAKRDANRLEGSLRGMTPTQVQARMGAKPDRIVRAATQDETMEQWIYLGTRGKTVVNFRAVRGRGTSEVISNYSLP